jgi:hypothetical protein
MHKCKHLGLNINGVFCWLITTMQLGPEKIV